MLPQLGHAAPTEASERRRRPGAAAAAPAGAAHSAAHADAACAGGAADAELDLDLAQLYVLESAAAERAEGGVGHAGGVVEEVT